jgi:hypothetical protein
MVLQQLESSPRPITRNPLIPFYPWNPHRHFSHILLIILTEAGEEQSLFVTRYVMQEADGQDPNDRSCQGDTDDQEATIEQDLTEVDRVADHTEHAFPDHRGILLLIAEHDGQPLACEVARYTQESGPHYYPDNQGDILVQERGVLEKKRVPYPHHPEQEEKE